MWQDINVSLVDYQHPPLCCSPYSGGDISSLKCYPKDVLMIESIILCTMATHNKLLWHWTCFTFMDSIRRPASSADMTASFSNMLWKNSRLINAAIIPQRHASHVHPLTSILSYLNICLHEEVLIRTDEISLQQTHHMAGKKVTQYITLPLVCLALWT